MDRNNKATLPRTAPSTVFKSSAKDLNPPWFEIIIQSDYPSRDIVDSTWTQPHTKVLEWWTEDHHPIFTCRLNKGGIGIVISSMDSDLEAFSHNPTHGSFAALTFQSTANTNYVNQRFLSYWVELLLQQHVSCFHQ